MHTDQPTSTPTGRFRRKKMVDNIRCERTQQKIKVPELQPSKYRRTTSMFVASEVFTAGPPFQHAFT